MLWQLYGYNTMFSFRFPKISGKLSACANSGYQALSFPTHREPGYEARYKPAHVSSHFYSIPCVPSCHTCSTALPGLVYCLFLCTQHTYMRCVYWSICNRHIVTLMRVDHGWTLQLWACNVSCTHFRLMTIQLTMDCWQTWSCETLSSHLMSVRFSMHGKPTSTVISFEFLPGEAGCGRCDNPCEQCWFCQWHKVLGPPWQGWTHLQGQHVHFGWISVESSY